MTSGTKANRCRINYCNSAISMKNAEVLIRHMIYCCKMNDSDIHVLASAKTGNAQLNNFDFLLFELFKS